MGLGFARAMRASRKGRLSLGVGKGVSNSRHERLPGSADFAVFDIYLTTVKTGWSNLE
jgi:hypothetical protein